MTIYTRMQKTAYRLLGEYKQGTIEIGRPVRTEGATPLDPPTTSVTWEEVNAVVRGVSAELVDGTDVLATDLVVTAFVENYDPLPTDLMRIDGSVVSIQRQEKIPAAGAVVAWRFIVRV